MSGCAPGNRSALQESRKNPPRSAFDAPTMNPIDLLVVAVACGAFAWTLARYAPKAMPNADLAAQGVLGVYTGLMVRDISFSALGSNWPIVIAITVSTLVVSVAGGALLGLHRDVSPLTGGLALVATVRPDWSPSPKTSAATTGLSRPCNTFASR